MSTPDTLSRADMEILEFARASWRYPGVHETAIRERFACTMARYHVRLNTLLSRPAAEEYDAPTVHRLRALREQRRAIRTAPGTVR